MFGKRGNETEIPITRKESKRMKNGVVSHNHPTGGSFSISDWKTFKNAELSEIRVITEDGIINKRERFIRSSEEYNRLFAQKCGLIYEKEKF